MKLIITKTPALLRELAAKDGAKNIEAGQPVEVVRIDGRNMVVTGVQRRAGVVKNVWCHEVVRLSDWNQTELKPLRYVEHWREVGAFIRPHGHNGLRIDAKFAADIWPSVITGEPIQIRPSAEPEPNQGNLF